MAQNITLLGASYSDCPAVLLPKTGGGTARFDDASVTTATASDVASGKVFVASDGTITTGTASGGGGGITGTDITIASDTTTMDNGIKAIFSAINATANHTYVVLSKTIANTTQGYLLKGIFYALTTRASNGSYTGYGTVFRNNSSGNTATTSFSPASQGVLKANDVYTVYELPYPYL